MCIYITLLVENLFYSFSTSKAIRRKVLIYLICADKIFFYILNNWDTLIRKTFHWRLFLIKFSHISDHRTDGMLIRGEFMEFYIYFVCVQNLITKYSFLFSHKNWKYERLNQQFDQYLEGFLSFVSYFSYFI